MNEEPFQIDFEYEFVGYDKNIFLTFCIENWGRNFPAFNMLLTLKHTIECGIIAKPLIGVLLQCI